MIQARTAVRRPRLRRSLLSGALLALLAGGPLTADAQLRPIEPMRWSVFLAGDLLVAEAGVTHLRGQRASLAGTEGTLWEVGAFLFFWRSGRIALEGSGTPYRIFADEQVFDAPYAGARPPDGSRRTDAGDFVVSTTVRLTPEHAPAIGTVRFGTRLPTTDNRVGLERDQTDFFAVVGGAVAHGPLTIGAETGVGIFGTREEQFEQSDVWMYNLVVEYAGRHLVPGAAIVGHTDFLEGRTIRGNEALAEVRANVRTAGPIWARAEVARGITTFSPRFGMRFSVGLTH